MKKIYRFLFLIIMILTGGVLGNTLSAHKAPKVCEDTSCRDDRKGGDRCFFVSGGEGWNCDDSGYPGCFMINCNN